MTPHFLIYNTMTKQEILDYISEHYGNNKSANRLKRIVFKNYSGKYIFYGDKKFEGNSKDVDELYNLINGN